MKNSYPHINAYLVGLKKKIGLENQLLNTHTLVLGSSHGQYSFIPQKGEYNLCLPSQNLYYSCSLYKKYCSRLKNLKNIVLFHSVFSRSLELVKTNEDFRCYHYKKLFDISPNRSCYSEKLHQKYGGYDNYMDIRAQKMRKLNFFILLLSQIFFSSEAFACLGRINHGWLRQTANMTMGLLLCWLCIFAVYFIIRGLICLISKNSEKRNIKLTYFIPALIYLILLGIVVCATYFITFDNHIYLYGIYTLCVLSFCGYQLYTLIKHKKPKNWTWVSLIVPFYLAIIAMIYKKTLEIHDDIINICLFVVSYIVISYGIHKLSESETLQHRTLKKFSWGMLIALICIYVTFILYVEYAYVRVLDFNDCI